MRKINQITIQGFRPFRDFTAPLGNLEVIVGANGVGKTALFEFLKFLRDAVYQKEIPPDIIRDSSAHENFHVSGGSFRWHLGYQWTQPELLFYEGQLDGPIGRINVYSERLYDAGGITYLELKEREGMVKEATDYAPIRIKRGNELALGMMNNPSQTIPYDLREYTLNWRFYSSFRLNEKKIRRPVVTEQMPFLDEDGGNLSAVLFYLLTEHAEIFSNLQALLKLMVPQFQSITVKARGINGEIIGFWQEADVEVSFSALSDGILRLLCWLVILMHPHLPPLICIDEPEQGIHPRTLTILASLIEKAAERTQILVATHDSYFLTQFEVAHIAVMQKEGLNVQWHKPAESALMQDMLADFGQNSLEYFHRSDELERFI